MMYPSSYKPTAADRRFEREAAAYMGEQMLQRHMADMSRVQMEIDSRPTAPDADLEEQLSIDPIQATVDAMIPFNAQPSMGGYVPPAPPFQEQLSIIPINPNPIIKTEYVSDLTEFDREMARRSQQAAENYEKAKLLNEMFEAGAIEAYLEPEKVQYLQGIRHVLNQQEIDFHKLYEAFNSDQMQGIQSFAPWADQIIDRVSIEDVTPLEIEAPPTKLGIEYYKEGEERPPQIDMSLVETQAPPPVKRKKKKIYSSIKATTASTPSIEDLEEQSSALSFDTSYLQTQLALATPLPNVKFLEEEEEDPYVEAITYSAPSPFDSSLIQTQAAEEQTRKRIQTSIENAMNEEESYDIPSSKKRKEQHVSQAAAAYEAKPFQYEPPKVGQLSVLQKGDIRKWENAYLESNPHGLSPELAERVRNFNPSQQYVFWQNLMGR